MIGDLTEQQRVTVEGLAALALGAAETSNGSGVLAMLEATIDGYGLPGIVRALQWWADAVLYDQHGLVPAGTPVVLQLVDQDGSDAQPADTDPLELWAARWMTARAALDDATCEALLAGLPAEAIVEQLTVAVFMAATTITPPEAALTAA